MQHRNAPTTASVSVAYLRPLLEWLQSQEVPVEPLLRASGIVPACLTDNGHRVSAQHFQALLQGASTTTRAPHLGLALGAQVDILAYGNLAGVLLTCIRMRDILDTVLTYEHVLQDVVKTRLSINGTEARLSFHVDASLAGVAQLLVEKEISEAVYAARYCLNRDLWPKALHFRHVRPADITPYTSVFPGVSLEFSATENAILFDAVLLDLPPRFCSTTAVADTLTVLAQGTSVRSLPNLIPLLKRECRLKLADGMPGIDDMARHFALSRRTLQRQLHLADTSFQQVLTDVRHECARELLQTTQLPVEDIAQQLGFSEARSFRQAFRRWTGLSPDAYRDRHVHAPRAESGSL